MFFIDIITIMICIVIVVVRLVVIVVIYCYEQIQYHSCHVPAPQSM